MGRFGIGDGGDTPLCPAGHLPLKGGDRPDRAVSHFTDAEVGAPVISPLEGEMSGRTEGGMSMRNLPRLIYALT